MRRFLRRVVYLVRRRRFERELEEEMRAHREMMSDARRPSFGSSLRFRDEARDAWGWSWLDQLLQDLAGGARQLRRAPAFTLTAVAVLALGVGLNLAVFHAFSSVWSARIPVADAESLLRVVRRSVDGDAWAFPPETVRWFHEHAGVFVHLVGERFGSIPVQVNGDEEDAGAQFVTGNYFDALGLAPGRGRLLAPADDRPGADPVVVLSDGYWQRRFGGDPAIVATTIDVNGLPVTVAGVLPTGFAGLSMSRGDLWAPMALRPRLLGETPTDRADTGLVGRLRPGVTPQAAATRMAALTADLRRLFPGLLANDAVVAARPLEEDDRRQDRASVLVVLVAIVLLAACATLGNMVLARGLARESELSTRVAVGASRARLVRQLMTESLVLAALGAMAGLVVGQIGARALSTVFAGSLNVRIVLDLPVIIAAAGLSLGSAVVFGLLPALQLTGPHRRASRWRSTLVAVQVWASCVLLILSGLMVRGTQRQTELAVRDDFASIVVLEPELEDARLTPPAVREALEGTIARIRALPEVVAVATGNDPIYGIAIASAPGLPTILQSRVDAEYFAVMRLALLQGRIFGAGDANVAVISASAARAAFGDDEAVGRIWRPRGETGGPVVVGVVEDSAVAALRDPGAVEVYLPITDAERAAASVILRTAGDGRAVLRRVRGAAPFAGAVPSVWLLQTPVDQLLQHSMAATEIIGVLGLAASALAALGLFGLMACSVRERTREVAIRMALGARARSVATLLIAQCGRPVGAGIAVGVVAAAAGAQALASQRLGLGLQVLDAGGYLLGMGLFLLAALAAILVPLRRAFRIDPASSLRAE